jgi:translation elongation factor EF-1alpha
MVSDFVTDLVDLLFHILIGDVDHGGSNTTADLCNFFVKIFGFSDDQIRKIRKKARAIGN